MKFCKNSETQVKIGLYVAKLTHTGKVIFLIFFLINHIRFSHHNIDILDNDKTLTLALSNAKALTKLS